ncbi:hypothetical protein EYF80_043948 [Liparis tanakae]|uniref:Uncharacterized protein n=1 Tax=Liparis tanakae TaxID=230148 RepID=A0A4Z2FY98_9TELE|nr:hypothetical protein EYF80_043948 [Liparis tanakae]
MIRFLPVSHVVQLSHGGTNQCPAVTPEFMKTAHGCQTRPPAQAALAEFTESSSLPRSYTHLILESEFQGPGFEGEMPYVTTDYSFDLTGAGKLRVFKGLTRPSHLGPK